MKIVRNVLAGACAIAMAAAGGVQTAGAAMASSAPGPTVCTSGVIPPGTYQGLVINGRCAIRNGPVRVEGNVVLLPNSVFNAVTKARLLVWGNILVGRGALAGLGCSPEVGCKFLTADRIHGNVVADHPLDVIIQSGIIYGNVSVTGGGGGRNCKNNPLLRSPNFSTVEDTGVRGKVSITGLRTCWFGLIRDHIHGNVTVRGNKFADPDANEIVTNVIYGNVACFRNRPGPHVGDSKGKPNVVFGKKRGQCRRLP